MGEKSRHLGDDAIMVVVHVEVNSLVFLRSRADDVIVVLFRHVIDLTLGNVSLKLFGLLNSAGTDWYAGVLCSSCAQRVCIGLR